jgi:hypothetical protein
LLWQGQEVSRIGNPDNQRKVMIPLQFFPGKGAFVENVSAKVPPTWLPWRGAFGEIVFNLAKFFEPVLD